MRKFELRKGIIFAMDYQQHQRRRKEERERESQRIRDGSSGEQGRQLQEETQEVQEVQEEEEIYNQEEKTMEETAAKPPRGPGTSQSASKSKATPPGSPKTYTGATKKLEKMEKTDKAEKADKVEKTDKTGKEQMTLEKLSEKMDKMNDQMLQLQGTIVTEVKETIQGLFLEFRKEVKQEMETMRKEFKTEIAAVKRKTRQNEIDVEELRQITIKTDTKLECHGMELSLRLRGILETKSEQVTSERQVNVLEGAVGGCVTDQTMLTTLEEQKTDNQKIIKALADFLEMTQEKMELLTDKIYRINSYYAKTKNLPRDVVVQLIKKSTRDEIMKKQMATKLNIEGKEVRIMKELPRQVLSDRKIYKQLVDKLRQQNIRFRWELPEGLSFTWDDKRWLIESLEDMKDFLNNEKI